MSTYEVATLAPKPRLEAKTSGLGEAIDFALALAPYRPGQPVAVASRKTGLVILVKGA